MALVVADVGELKLLDNATGKGTPENLTLKLYKNNYTPVAGSVAGDFTVADFTNYVNKTLTIATWGAATTVSNKGSATYGSAQTWTCGATGNTVYGYYIIGASSGTLYWAEKFDTARTLANGDTLNITPALTLNSEN